jgi:VIT1/CCC1 family predicted Fe2+/Mn2+ transporter
MDAQERDTQEQRTKQIREVVGVFDNLATLQSAIDELLTDGFDRSDISLLAEEKAVAPKSGSRRAVELEDDERAPRLPYIESESLSEGKASLIGGLFYIGAFVGAGALTAAGGILASPIVAGALTGSVAGLAGLVLSKLIGDRQVKWMVSQLEKGGLLLWARTWTEEREREAVSIMQRNGGHDVHIHAVTV